MLDDWFMKVVYIIGAIMVCVHMIAFMRRLAHRAASVNLNKVLQALRPTPCWFWRRSEKENDQDVISLLVKERMELEAVKSMKSAVVYFTQIYVFATVTVFLNLFLQSARWMTPEQDVVLVFTTCVHSFLHFFPSLISRRTFRPLYAGLMACPIMFNGFSSDAFGSYATSAIVCMMRMAYSVAFFDELVVPLVNILAFAASCVQRMIDHDREAKQLLMFELGVCIYVIAAARTMWESRRSMVRQEITATTLKGETAAQTGLLNLVCDVVVELDQDLHIIEDAPKLSALLTLGGRTRSLKGAKLQDFMPAEEDKQRFEQRLLEPAADNDFGEGQGYSDFLPGALPVKMLDSLGNNLSVELFYSQCKYLGQRRFFIGLREQMYEPIGDLEGFARKKKKKHGSRRRNAASASTDAEASAEESEASSSNGSGDSDLDPSELGGSSSNLQPGRLIAPSWKRITDKGKNMVVVRALEKCNIRLGRKCCAWHAAISDMKTTLDRFEGYSCARGFTVVGDWQCAQCLAMESRQPGDDNEIGIGQGVQGCSTCSHYGRLLQQSGGRVQL